jgi:SpoVK/Ycf46/Vps4 family AAA+-type ATPase
LKNIATASKGFSGAELEQAVVSACYAAMAANQKLATKHILAELKQTRPLSVVMAEKIDSLRRWAKHRTVPAD